MSKYTFRLRDFCETIAESEFTEFSDIENVINNSVSSIFDFTVTPTDGFTAAEWLHFQKHFIHHYYMNEINYSTWGEFKYRLCAKLNDIMPVYNERMKLVKRDIDFINDYDVVTDNTSTGTNSRTASGTNEQVTISTDTHDNRNLYSDTPQSAIDLEPLDYVTNMTKDFGTNQSDGTTTGSNNSSESGTNTNTGRTETKGTFGNNADKFQKAMQVIQNIELDIIKDCRGLFMKLF